MHTEINLGRFGNGQVKTWKSLNPNTTKPQVAAIKRGLTININELLPHITSTHLFEDGVFVVVDGSFYYDGNKCEFMVADTPRTSTYIITDDKCITVRAYVNRSQSDEFNEVMTNLSNDTILGHLNYLNTLTY